MKNNAIFYTASMARLCADQGYFDKSLEIYRCLLETDPANDALRSALNTVEQVKAAAVDFATAEDEAPVIIVGEEADEEETIADAIKAISGAEKESVEMPKAAATDPGAIEDVPAVTETVVATKAETAGAAEETPDEMIEQPEAVAEITEAEDAPPVVSAEKHAVDKETAATEAGAQGGLEPVIKKWVELMIEHDLKAKFDKIRKAVTYLQPPTV